jgi:hypothetical protein
MKQLFLFSTTLLIGLSALAQFKQLSCDSLSGNEMSLSLIVINGDLRQVRVQSSAQMPRALMVNRVNNHLPDQTLYTIVGSPSLMFVDNSVLTADSGHVRIDSTVFSCFLD